MVLIFYNMVYLMLPHHNLCMLIWISHFVILSSSYMIDDQVWELSRHCLVNLLLVDRLLHKFFMLAHWLYSGCTFSSCLAVSHVLISFSSIKLDSIKLDAFHSYSLVWLIRREEISIGQQKILRLRWNKNFCFKTKGKPPMYNI